MPTKAAPRPDREVPAMTLSPALFEDSSQGESKDEERRISLSTSSALPAPRPSTPLDPVGKVEPEPSPLDSKPKFSLKTPQSDRLTASPLLQVASPALKRLLSASPKKIKLS
jgi:hypothetical protein